MAHCDEMDVMENWYHGTLRRPGSRILIQEGQINWLNIIAMFNSYKVVMFQPYLEQQT